MFPKIPGRKFVREREREGEGGEKKRGEGVGRIVISKSPVFEGVSLAIKVAREIDQWFLTWGEPMSLEFFIDSPGAREGIVSFDRRGNVVFDVISPRRMFRRYF